MQAHVAKLLLLQRSHVQQHAGMYLKTSYHMSAVIFSLILYLKFSFFSKVLDMETLSVALKYVSQGTDSTEHV